MIFHWSDDTIDLEYGVKVIGLGTIKPQEGRPFAITLTFPEMLKLMQDPVYMHHVTYVLTSEVPTNYKERIQK